MDSYYYSGPPNRRGQHSFPSQTPERHLLAYVQYTTMRRAYVASKTTHNNENPHKHIQPTWRVLIPQSQLVVLSTVRQNFMPDCYVDQKARR